MKATLMLAVAITLGSTAAWAADRHHGWTSVQHNNEPTITGNGQVIRQVRPIGAVDAIEMAGASDAVVRVGPAASLTIEAESNILPLLTSETRGSTLKMGSRGSYRTQHSPRYFITLPRLAALNISGSGDADIIGVSSDQLRLGIQGSGDIRASGRTRYLRANVSGSGDMALRSLGVGDADVTVQGSGNITVAAAGRVTASSYGSGDIELVGRPASLAIHKGGSGSVRTVGR